MKNALTQPCNLCQSSEFEVLSSTDRDGNYLRSVICQGCGLVWSDPFPIDVTPYYQTDYRILYKGTFQPKIKHVYRAAQAAITRYRQLKKLFTGQQQILEVGSGGGEFAYLLSQLGHQVQGIEPNEGYGNYAKTEYGLNIQLGFAQNIEFAEASFDSILSFHVLEHTDNPSLVLTKLHRWLKPHGTLVIEVPNVEAVCQSPKHTFHIAHLFNFNRATLKLLAEKSGFAVKEMLLSADGGNLIMIAQQNPALTIAPLLSLENNCQTIKNRIQQHTPLAHYFSIYPYWRLLNKLPRLIQEKRMSQRFTQAKVLLDYCYQAIISKHA